MPEPLAPSSTVTSQWQVFILPICADIDNIPLNNDRYEVISSNQFDSVNMLSKRRIYKQILSKIVKNLQLFHFVVQVIRNNYTFSKPCGDDKEHLGGEL